MKCSGCAFYRVVHICLTALQCVAGSWLDPSAVLGCRCTFALSRRSAAQTQADWLTADSVATCTHTCILRRPGCGSQHCAALEQNSSTFHLANTMRVHIQLQAWVRRATLHSRRWSGTSSTSSGSASGCTTASPRSWRWAVVVYCHSALVVLWGILGCIGRASMWRNKRLYNGTRHTWRWGRGGSAISQPMHAGCCCSSNIGLPSADLIGCLCCMLISRAWC